MTGAAALAADHTVFADLLERNGEPPAWRRLPTFATLVRLILEQQVSLASAAAAYRRLEDRVGSVTPEAVLDSTPRQLHSDGFSRQKAGYVTGLAELIVAGAFDLEQVALEPRLAEERLLAVRGIGPWTSSCFRLFALGDVDVWPSGDRALYISMGRNLGMDGVPVAADADAIASGWAPHRSTAARMLWHDYLGGRAYVQSPDAGFV